MSLEGKTSNGIDGDLITVEELTPTFWTGTAGWSEEIWSFKDGEYPQLKGFAAEAPEKTVSVDTQNGTLTAGTAGSVTFTVTTTNITNGSEITLDNLDEIDGITLETTATTGDSTEITISTTEATPAGSHSLKVTIDGTESNAFTLTVNKPLVKSVSVGGQSGTLTAGTGGSVTFTVETANIDSSSAITLNTGNVDGITLDESAASTTDNSTEITIKTTDNTPAGSHSLTVTIDGVESNAFTLTVINPLMENIGKPGEDTEFNDDLDESGGGCASAGIGGAAGLWLMLLASLCLRSKPRKGRKG
jgi:hypothetical protein